MRADPTDRRGGAKRTAIDKYGLKLLRQDGWDKVRDGLTTPEEVLRVAKA